MPSPCLTKAEIKKYKLEGMNVQQQIKALLERVDDMPRRRTNARLQFIKAKIKQEQALSHPKGPDVGLKGLVYTDRTELSGRAGVDMDISAINSGYHSRIYEILEEFMPRKAGLDTNSSNQINLLKAIRGEEVDPKYTKMAEELRGVSDDILERFNGAGGGIKTLQDWGISVYHSAPALRKMGYAGWYEKIFPRLNLKIMGIDKANAKLLFEDIYNDIISDGKFSQDPIGFSPTEAMANRHGTSRYFKFNNAEDQLAYMDEFSDASVSTSVSDYITTLSQEIGLMEAFGPNPEIGFQTVLNAAKQAMSLNKKNQGHFGNAINAWAELAGKTRPNSVKWADRMSTVRNLETGLKLTGAMLSAIPDVMTNAMTSRYNGIPFVKVMKRFIGNLSHISAEDRKFAARLHQPLQFMLDSAHSAMRFSDVTGHRGSARFASFVMRASGLNAWTVAGKMAFHAEFMSTLSDVKWNKATLRTMKRYGITDSDKNIIRESTKFNKDGVEYLDPAVLPRATRERIIAMVNAENKYAVPEGDVLTKAILHQGTRKGEIPGEIMRGGGMFKTFMSTIIANHWARSLYGFENNGAAKLGYATTMAIGTTVIGTMVYQLKEIAYGREPVDWDNPSLWTAGAALGGTGSLLGDIVKGDSRDFGQTLIDLVGGPIASDLNKILFKGILGTMDDMVDSEKEIAEVLSKIPGDLAAGSASIVPGQFWYSKLIMERMLLDSMRRLGDEDFDAKRAQRDRKHYEDFENERYY